MRTIRDQLVDAFIASGQSKSRLAARAKIDRSVLSRSLDGKRALKTGAGALEPETIAKALGGRFVFVPAGFHVVRKRVA